jgi:tetratricopeptide (TPR) repeat protein
MVVKNTPKCRLVTLAVLVALSFSANLSTAQNAKTPIKDSPSQLSPAFKAGDTAEAKTTSAKKLYHANDSEALALFAKNWITEEPDSMFANFYLGAGLRDASPKDALSYLLTAQKLGLKSDTLMFELGQVLQLLERYEESVLYLSRAIELDSDIMVYHKQMAITLTLVGKSSESLPFFKRAIELGGTSLHTIYSYGVSAYRARKLALSKELLMSVLEQNPAYEGAAQTLGVVYFDEKNYKKAIDVYRAGLVMLPASAELFNNMSNAHRYLKQYPQALAAAQKAIDLQPSYITAHLNLATAHIKLKNLTAARQAIAFAIDQAPSSASAWAKLIYIEHLEKNVKAREAAMTQLESIDLEAAQATRKRSFQLE